MIDPTGWSISDQLFDVIRSILQDGKTILELGSGVGTQALSKYYNMYSVEHNKEWIGKYNSTYIHAPLVEHKLIAHYTDNMWYDAHVLRKRLPKHYDLLLVDGPPASARGRSGFIKYWKLFRHDVPMVFDDIDRTTEQRIINKISGRLRRPYTVYGAWDSRFFGVILP